MHPLRSLVPFLGPYRGALIAGVVSIALSAGFGSLSPIVVKLAIDALRGNATWRTISMYALAIVAIAAVQGVFRYTHRRVVYGASRRVEADLRDALYARLLRQRPAFFDALPTGDVMSRMSNDVGAVRMALGPGIQFGVNTVATLSLAIGFMLWLDPVLTVWALLPLPFVSLTVKFMGQRIHRLSLEAQAALADVTTAAAENLAGLRVVRAYGRGEAEQARFGARSRTYVDANLRVSRIRALLGPVMTFLLGSSLLILLWIGGGRVIDGQLTLGDLVAFLMYLGMISWPLIAIGWIANLFQRAAAAMGRLNVILHADAMIDESASDPAATITDGAIAFRGVSFSYRADRGPVFEGLDLEIAAGTAIGITGPTGGGKTTLARLIARLYEPTEGAIEIDGRPLPDYPLEVLRGAIAVAPQEPLLFSDTLATNLLFGANGGDGNALTIDDAVEIAGLRTDIEGFPDRLETAVGERGVTLSGGQKQRGALARALLADPKILVLDDAFSSVDTETEARILERLRAFMAARTTLLIGHRASTLRFADRIVVIDGGRVAESGTHDELLELDGWYAALYRRQQLEAALEEG